MLIRACKNYHQSLLYSILRCNMQFFESTPIGRILNRFSKDLEVTETRIPDFFRMFVRSAFNVLSVIVVISITQPFFMLFFIPIAVGYAFVQVRYYYEYCRDVICSKITLYLREYLPTTLDNSSEWNR